MNMRIARLLTSWFWLPLAVWLVGCGQQTSTGRDEGAEGNETVDTTDDRDIIANNAFFYYDDLETAWRFYEDTLGLRTVADYGFAKIMRIARTSYLTLVDAESGMHSADEPKTVAIALVTDELDDWYQYLRSENVPMRSEYNPEEGRPHHGFVAFDPEGYFLEFERFNPHPENEQLIPMLDAIESISTEPSNGRPKELGFKATVLWLYYKDLAATQRFYEDVMGLDMVVDQGWAKIYPTSPTGFIGLVDSARGMHSWTQDKGVTVSFLTEHVDNWFAHLKDQEAFELRTEEVLEEGRVRVRVFVGYDPEGYFLEFDTFLEGGENGQLLALLREAGR